jgi:hypothetical protein
LISVRQPRPQPTHRGFAPMSIAAKAIFNYRLGCYAQVVTRIGLVLTY